MPIPPAVEAEALTLAVQLGEQLVKLLNGDHSAEQAATNIIAQGNAFLVSKGQAPVPAPTTASAAPAPVAGAQHAEEDLA